MLALGASAGGGVGVDRDAPGVGGLDDRIQEGVAETSQGVLRCCGGRVASAPNPTSASMPGPGYTISAQK